MKSKLFFMMTMLVLSASLLSSCENEVEIAAIVEISCDANQNAKTILAGQSEKIATITLSSSENIEVKNIVLFFSNNLLNSISEITIISNNIQLNQGTIEKDGKVRFNNIDLAVNKETNLQVQIQVNSNPKVMSEVYINKIVLEDITSVTTNQLFENQEKSIKTSYFSINN
jgi:hypothetical protein